MRPFVPPKVAPDGSAVIAAAMTARPASANRVRICTVPPLPARRGQPSGLRHKPSIGDRAKVNSVSLPAGFVAGLETVLPSEALIREPEQLRTYECDGLTGHRMIPALVALPGSAAEVQAVVRACHSHGVP